MSRPRSELFGMAFETLRRNPGRSVLTLLGLAIGVAAFIAMVSFGEGARRAVMDQFQALGTHLIRALGMRADLKAGTLRLDSDVNGQFAP